MTSDNINVVVRAKPLLNEEPKFVPWNINDDSIHLQDDDHVRVGDSYSFDKIFNVDKQNVDVYSTAISPLVYSAIEGINITIFAYGATSSGKTYTMNGTSEDPGVIPRFIEDLFEEIEKCNHRKFLLRVSYVEIYGEVINDLLDKSNKDLKIREDYNSCVSYNPKEYIIKSCEECLNYMKIGSSNRKTGETQMNAVSSRSHSIFRIVIESTPVIDNKDDPVQVSHVNLIDLAGSERVSQTLATGQRFKEAAHINKSLTTLGLVMKQLVEKKEFISYRDSKLTRILSNSLGGNAKTLIICNINLMSSEDTASTLMFAQRAKAVRNKPKINVLMTEASLTKKYANQCLEVKKLLEAEFEKNKKLIGEQAQSSQKIGELLAHIQGLEENFIIKKPAKKRPRRRHTFCAGLGAIFEEKEPETISTYSNRNDFSEDDAFKTNRESSVTSSQYYENMDNSGICTPKSTRSMSQNETPVENLRERLRILSREYDELLEFTKLEKSMRFSVEEELTQRLELLEEECKGLRECRRKVEHEIQILKQKERDHTDYDCTIESLKKKFGKREEELIEKIRELSSKNPVVIDFPLSEMTEGIFEYEEMFENYNSMKKQVNELHNMYDLLKIEYEKTKMNADVYKTETVDLKNVINKLEQDNLQLKTESKNLQFNLSQIQSQILTLELQMDTLKTELMKVKNDLFESQDKLIEVTEDLDIEEKKSARLETELRKAQTLLKEAELKLNEKLHVCEPKSLADVRLLLYKLESILDPKPIPIEILNVADSCTSLLTTETLKAEHKRTEVLGETVNNSFDISSESIKSFSTSFLENSKETQEFMDFFHSFGLDTTAEKNNLTGKVNDDWIERENKLLDKIRKLENELKSMNTARATDSKRIINLQKKLEEYSNINLSDSEKIEKTNKHSKKAKHDLEVLQAEKSNCMLLIDNLRIDNEQEISKNDELQKAYDAKCSELNQKELEFQLVLQKNSELSNSVAPLNLDGKKNEQQPIIDTFNREMHETKPDEVEMNEKQSQTDFETNDVHHGFRVEVESKERIIEQMEREIVEVKNYWLLKESKLTNVNEEKLRNLADKIEKLKLENKKLLALLVNNGTSVEKVNSDKNILAEQISELIEKLKHKDTELCLYHEKNTDLIDRMNSMNQENLSQKSEIANQKKMIANMNNNLDEEIRIKLANAELIDHLKKELETKLVVIRSKEKKITEIESDYSIKLNELMEQHKKTTKTFTDQIEKLKEDNQALSVSLNEKDAFIQRMTTEKNSLKEELECKKTELQSTVKNQEVLLSKIANLEKENNSKFDLINSLSTDLRKVRENMEQVNAEEISNLNSTINSLKNEIELNRQIIVKQEQELSEIKNNNMTFNTYTAKHEEEIKKLSDVIRNLKIENENLTVLMREKSASVVVLTMEKTRLERELLDKENKTTRDFTEQIEQLIEESGVLSVSLQEKVTFIDKILSEKNSLKVELEQTKTELQSKVKYQDKLLNQIDNLEEENYSQKIDINKKIDLINSLSTDLKKVGENIEQVTAADISNLNSTINSLKNEIELKQQAIVKQEREISEIKIINSKSNKYIAKYEEKVKELSGVIGKLKSENENLTIFVEEKKALIETLTVEKTRLEKENIELNIKLKGITQEDEIRRAPEPHLDQITRLRYILKPLNSGDNARECFIFRRGVDKEDQLKYLVNKVSSLMEKHNLLKQQNENGYKTLEAQNNELIQELKVTNMKLDKLISEHNSLRIEYESVREKYELAVKEKERLKCYVDDLTLKKEEVEQKLANLSFEHQKSLDKLIQLQNRCQQLGDRKKHEQTEIRNSDTALISEMEVNCFNKQDKWKKQRTQVHDSRRSIDLNTLCSENTVDTCNNCDFMNAKLHDMRIETTKLRKHIETMNVGMDTLKNKYETIKKLCRIRNDELKNIKKATT